jgi:hypothetical protein
VLTNGTFRAFFAEKSLINSLKSSSRSKLLSMLRRESFDRRFCPILVFKNLNINNNNVVQWHIEKGKSNNIIIVRIAFASSCQSLLAVAVAAGWRCICNLKDFFSEVTIVEAPFLWGPRGYRPGCSPLNPALYLPILYLSLTGIYK